MSFYKRYLKYPYYTYTHTYRYTKYTYSYSMYIKYTYTYTYIYAQINILVKTLKHTSRSDMSRHYLDICVFSEILEATKDCPSLLVRTSEEDHLLELEILEQLHPDLGLIRVRWHHAHE